VREMDQRSRDELIARLEQGGIAHSGQDPAAVATFAAQKQEIIKRLRAAPLNGRLIIGITSDIGHWENTEADVELRAGDVLIIPKRPSFVIINGQVTNQSAITFVKGKTASWYLRKAGGFTPNADSKAVFVVKSNGTVVGRHVGGWWSRDVLDTVMEAGDSLIVPEKIRTSSEFWKSLLTTAQLTSSLAIAARAVAGF
jgi:hypothetical protein